MTRSAFIAMLTCFIALGGTATAGTAGNPARNADRAAMLRAQLHQLVAAGIPGAVVLVRDGDRTITLTGGVSDLKSKAPMRAETKFRIGSLTKSFTATVVLQLVGEGKLSLDDSLARRLPGVVPNGREITIRQLLNHTSGIYDYARDARTMKPYLEGRFEFAWKPRQLIAFATSHKPLFAPGRRVAYSNTEYTVLGLIVERLTQNSLGAEVRARILEPLRLRATTFATSPRIAAPYAHGYLLDSDKPPTDVTGVSPSHTWAAGNIVSTAGDVSTFYRALLAGRLLQPDLLRAMKTGVSWKGGISSGLGLFRYGFPCGGFYGHNGEVAGYGADAFVSEDGQRQFVVLVSSNGNEQTGRLVERLLTSAACR